MFHKYNASQFTKAVFCDWLDKRAAKPVEQIFPWGRKESVQKPSIENRLTLKENDIHAFLSGEIESEACMQRSCCDLTTSYSFYVFMLCAICEAS